MQDRSEAYFVDLYHRTRLLWESLEGQYPTWLCRFSILYGPPTQRPELLILGANPGYNPSDIYDREILRWPEKTEYLERDWPLARKIRAIFLEAGLPEILKYSVGTNLLFFKSKSLGKHESGLGWENNPSAIRHKLESYCLNEVAGIINSLKPQALLVLGLSIFDRVNDGSVRPIFGTNGRRIGAVGQAFGRKMIGIIHPTGAQVSTVDWSLVASALADQLDGAGLPAPSSVERPRQLPSSSEPKAKDKRHLVGNRQAPFRPETIVQVATRPPGTFGYRPIHDFWQELAKVGPISIESFHTHMLSIGWIRPQGKALTYEITRIDVASMCKNGFARRLD